MKKVSIVTMHRIYNYGSVLQAYATQRLFENSGAECEIIDYISPYRAKKPLFFEYPSRLEGKKFRKVIYYVAKVPSFILKDITFGGFIKKHLHLTPQVYITNDDLLKNPPQADVYVTGSDQVWNSKYNHGVDGSYYLNFVKNGKKKAAFVSSFGRTELEQKEQEEIKPLLSEYAAISVREDSAVDILKHMGLQSECLIDPTLQIPKEEWLQLASRRLVKGRYLLLFLLYNEDGGAAEYATKIAAYKGLKVVKLSWELKKPAGTDILFTHRKPQDFLSLFANADFVVTNSFHGVAFSINLNRQFVFVPRKEFNGRIESLLALTNLEDRKLENGCQMSIEESFIDYQMVNTILNEERARAKKYLQEIIK